MEKIWEKLPNMLENMGKMTEYLKSNEIFLGFSLDVGCVLPAFSGTFQPMPPRRGMAGVPLLLERKAWSPGTAEPPWAKTNVLLKLQRGTRRAKEGVTVVVQHPYQFIYIYIFLSLSYYFFYSQ